jgi:hypothetical protein
MMTLGHSRGNQRSGYFIDHKGFGDVMAMVPSQICCNE